MGNIKKSAMNSGTKAFFDTIEQCHLPADEYIHEETEKIQGYWHLTAGWYDGHAVLEQWDRDCQGPVGTTYLIEGFGKNAIDGHIIQCFNSKYWIYHLGLRQQQFSQFKLPFKRLDKVSIGVEVCNPGPVILTDKGYMAYKHIFADEEIYELEYPHRGHRYWVKFTEKQIQSMYDLARYLEKVHGIPAKFRGMEIFDMDSRALAGEPGWYTHCSVQYPSIRADIPPQPEVIQMFKSL